MDLDNEEIEATRNLKVKGRYGDVKSIDEAIWRCKELIKPKHINWIGGMNQSAIKILLGNLEALSDMQDSANREITELKKQNRELIDEYHKKVQEVIDLEQDIKILQDDFEDKRLVYIDTPEFQDSYISKQKIKDKIEEFKSENYQIALDSEVAFDTGIMKNNLKIQVLEELLQESENNKILRIL